VIDERELRRLAARGTEVPDVNGVVRRGRQLRRARRVWRGAAALSSVAVVVAAVAVVSRVGSDAAPVELAAPVDLPAGVAPPDDDGEDCGGYAELRDPEEAAVPRLMPEWLPPGLEVGHAWARAVIAEHLTCPPVPTALVALRPGDGGAIAAAVRVRGPSAEPFRQYEALAYEHVTVRTDEGAQLVRFPADPSFLQAQWTEPDGTSWSMIGHGVDSTTLLAVAEDLDLQGSGGTPVAHLRRPVDGLEEVWNLDELPGELPPGEPYWHVSIDDGQTLSIDVSRPLVPTPAISVADVPGARLVEVRGHTAVAVTEGSPFGVWLTWDEEPGLRVSISGSLDLDTLVRIAESLAPAAPDDQRIPSH
jgi:hypothetical protein